jgi:hypothetical protein
MSSSAEDGYVFELPVWFVVSRDPKASSLATGNIGGSTCVLLFTDPGLARRCVRENQVAHPGVGRLGSPEELHDFLRKKLPAGVTHVAFDVGKVGDVPPAVVPYQELVVKLRELMGK